MDCKDKACLLTVRSPCWAWSVVLDRPEVLGRVQERLAERLSALVLPAVRTHHHWCCQAKALQVCHHQSLLVAIVVGSSLVWRLSESNYCYCCCWQDPRLVAAHLVLDHLEHWRLLHFLPHPK